jgi:hypothetical protein
VLVVLHPDGYVAAFGIGADVRIVTLLDVSTPQAEVLAEQYVDAALPHRFRALHLPQHLVATAMLERRTADDEAERCLNLELLQAARRLAS